MSSPDLLSGLTRIHKVASKALDEIKHHLKPDGYRVAVVIAHPTDREKDIVVTDADESLLLAAIRERGRSAGPAVPANEEVSGGWRWPTADEVDGRTRWWWVGGEPSILHVDRMKHPHRVMWHARYVEELPIEMFAGPVLFPGEPPFAEKHVGWTVSISGLLSQVKGELKRSRYRQQYAGQLDELVEHLGLMANQFYAGDVFVVDRFLQLYNLGRTARAQAVGRQAVPRG